MKRNPTARQGRDSMDSINNSPHRIREKDNNRPNPEKGSKGARGPAIVIDRKDRQIASQPDPEEEEEQEEHKRSKFQCYLTGGCCWVGF